jgi:hypothetical protein
MRRANHAPRSRSPRGGDGIEAAARMSASVTASLERICALAFTTAGTEAIRSIEIVVASFIVT